MFARFHALATLRLLGLRYRSPRSSTQTTQGLIDSARVQLAYAHLRRINAL